MAEDPAARAEALLTPGAEALQLAPVTKEDLQGLFSVHCQVNPDLPFQRQLLTELGTQLVPLLERIYPVGAQRLLAAIWTINGQTHFEEYYPPGVALLQTQQLFAQILAQTMQQSPLRQDPSSIQKHLQR